MNKKHFLLLLALSLAAGPAFAQGKVGGWDPETIRKAEETIAAFTHADSGLRPFLEKAHAYAVFPSIGKGAIGIGGAYGSGVVFKGGKPVGETTLSQITIGFQLGGQAYSEIVFFETKPAFEQFITGRFELAAQASAVAVHTGASADLAYSDRIAIVTMAKGGLMYEASVGGQKFSYRPVSEDGEAAPAKEPAETADAPDAGAEEAEAE